MAMFLQYPNQKKPHYSKENQKTKNPKKTKKTQKYDSHTSPKIKVV